MSATKSNTILVTGDVVLDCHLYGGVKTAATSFSEPGSVYTEHLGGADLSRKMLAAAADAAGLAWDAKKQKWDKENEERAKENAKRVAQNSKLKAEGEEKSPDVPPLPWPANLKLCRPQPAYASYLGIDDTNLKDSLPDNLRSFGVWTPHLKKKGVKDPTDTVWRVQKHFGYGPAPTEGARPQFALAKDPPSDPSLILLDDGGIIFRHKASKQAWPPLSQSGSATQQPFVVLKMSAPLCRGDLWPQLIRDAAVAKRLLVIVSAADLRREDAQIRQHLSWEQCAADALCALYDTPISKELLKAAHIVVNFRSAGALWLHREDEGADHKAELVFDPIRLEGDFSRDFDGTVYGFQTCLAVSIAHHILTALAKGEDRSQAISMGIVCGLQARRKLLELGHGKVGKGKPGFPITEIGQVIADVHGGFVNIAVPPVRTLKGACLWSILADSQNTGNSDLPHIGLAQLTAIHGRNALSQVPSLALDKLFAVDRSEIESLRTLERLIREYEDVKVQKKPLSIGVFGPPGAGKSFGVKALAKAILGEKVPVLEFNLSQFKDPEDLIGAFHRVRDEVLKGITPVAFWDEFDSQRYKWLQYLLAPMQDGTFQEGQITHPIGKCIFIFAGGTADTMATFGVSKPSEQSVAKRKELGATEREDLIKEEDAYQEFKFLKGPDFVSRLHGHLDVLGPNPRKNPSPKCPDLTWPIRRALMLRGVLELKDDPAKPDVLDMDPGLLFALLAVPNYENGSRSFEKILLALAQDRQEGHYHRSALPPDPLLNRETDAREFYKLVNQRNAFNIHPDIEQLAAAIHFKFLDQAKKSQLEAEMKAKPELAWTIHPSIQMDYEQLDADKKASNRAAARRIPDHLALIGYVVELQQSGDDGSWKDPLNAAMKKHLERLAQAEHLGWQAERIANGWVYAEERNESLKHHPSLLPWSQLGPRDQEKDRASVLSIPELLDVAKFKAVPVNTPA